MQNSAEDFNSLIFEVKQQRVCQLNLLVVEDDEDIREIIKFYLQEIFDEIDFAQNGVEAIELIASKKYSLIVSDQSMPGKTGLEVLRWMRQNGIEVPFIIQTGFESQEIVSQAISLGAFAIVEKTGNKDNLLSCVREAIKAP